MRRFETNDSQQDAPNLSAFVADAEKFTWLAWSGETNEDDGILGRRPEGVTLDETIEVISDIDDLDFISIVQATWEPKISRDVVDRADYYVRTSQLEMMFAAIAEEFAEEEKVNEMTKRKYFSGPEEYEAYTPYILVIEGEVHDAFTNKRSAERASEKLPPYIYGEVMTRRQFAIEQSA